MFKKIYTILVLLFNTLIRKRHYTLSFDKDEHGQWFYRFKHWGFDYENLLMVSGADKLCESLSNSSNSVTVDIIASRKPIVVPEGYHKYNGEDLSIYKGFASKHFYGRSYISNEPINGLDSFWICPVTLFVLGRYPNYIYIKNNR